MLGLAAGGGEWGFILPDYDVAAAAAWLLCHGPDPRPTAPATASANAPGCRDSPHDTTASSTARYNNASHNSTTQHQLLLSDPRPQARTLLCPCRLQIFAATLSFQAAAQPSTYYKSALAEYFTNILHSRIFTHFGNYGLDPGPGLPG